MTENNQSKLRIDVGTLVKAKVGDMEYNTREVIISRISKEVVKYAQSLIGKNKILVQFQDFNKIDISSCYILYVYSREGVVQ